jgi:hypothetical protein
MAFGVLALGVMMFIRQSLPSHSGGFGWLAWDETNCIDCAEVPEKPGMVDGCQDLHPRKNFQFTCSLISSTRAATDRVRETIVFPAGSATSEANEHG